MITVKELIERLHDLPPDHRVVINGYEGGLDDLDTMEEIMIELNVNDQWYYGPHERVNRGKGSEPAVFLRKKSN